ncbi:hypothetical protein [Streptomyces sp. NPDC086010]
MAERHYCRYYDEEHLVALVSLVTLINAYNRVNVMSLNPMGDYRPGQFG